MPTLIYARGTDDEIADQQRECRQTVELAGEAVSMVAADPPGGCADWIRALALLSSGQVDRILVASRRVIPPEVGSVTQDISAHWPRVAGWIHRIREARIEAARIEGIVEGYVEGVRDRYQ